MAPPYLVLPQLLPVHAVPVGSLVCSLLEPHVDIFKRQLGPDVDPGFQTTALDLSGFVQKSRETRFHAALTQLLNVHTQPGSAGGTHLASKAVKRYEMTSHREAFAELCASEDARAWLEESVRAGEKCYLIVGVTTVLDARVSQAHSRRIATGVDLTAPVSTALTGGIDVFGILDPGVGVEKTRVTEECVSFDVPGEMIWAIAYRKIKFRSFRKNVDTAFLDKAIHWKPMMNQRAKHATDEEELEVELDDIDLEDEDELMDFAADADDETFIVPQPGGDTR
ncbi:hypothetical protein DBV05_g12435 [Lasiodiplodia theobromae]|uniref:Uncharacterized protein n=1 Tax=Lasiodiplodia theobromae TaxID=45133 RepID=A0A5N5CU68_9PEZI|nr:hypothetical protein DBV05_g12435 [Lasiodiplodia theobromae]